MARISPRRCSLSHQSIVAWIVWFSGLLGSRSKALEEALDLVGAPYVHLHDAGLAQGCDDGFDALLDRLLALGNRLAICPRDPRASRRPLRWPSRKMPA